RDPTSFDNRSKPSGRGLFVLRLVAEEVEWCENGRVVTLYFPRRTWERPKAAGQVCRTNLAFWPETDESLSDTEKESCV
ncbi:MAG TPA: hypothetical protein PKO06_08290, partial [Candidatus Ozemobacteraceae bacterium]|nr:hypothetical protein [Candidatus Ozemobacteraceae bacterium]